MPNPFTGESYFYEKDKLPTSNKNNVTPKAELTTTPTSRTSEVLPDGSLQGTMRQPEQKGSLTDFTSVMRTISESAYDYRQKKEGKVLEGQFDPSKVSGSIFSQIMGSVEAKRGQDISKVYEGAVEAAKFDIEQTAQAVKARTGTLAERKGGALAVSQTALLNARGEDGYVDPNAYLAEMNTFLQTGGTITEFNEEMGNLLSPENKMRMGVGGGYTEQENRKLRAAGINPADTKNADEYLYGDNLTPEERNQLILEDSLAVNVANLIEERAPRETIQAELLDKFGYDLDELAEAYDIDMTQANKRVIGDFGKTGFQGSGVGFWQNLWEGGQKLIGK